MRSLLLATLPCSLSVWLGPGRPLCPVRCMPPMHTWDHSLPTQRTKFTHFPKGLHHMTPQVALALQHRPRWSPPVLRVPPWLPTADGANVGRLKLPVTRRLSARPRTPEGCAYAGSKQETACPMSPKQQVVLTPWAGTHASFATPRRPCGKGRTGWLGTSA